MCGYDAHAPGAMSPRRATELCDRHAAAWQKLSEWMQVANLADAEDAYESFVQALEHALRAWGKSTRRASRRRSRDTTGR